MAHRSQSSSLGDNPLDPNYLPPHYREEYRLAIDALVEDDVEAYHEFLQKAGVADFLCRQEVNYIRSTVQLPRQISQPELTYRDYEADGSSDTYWPIHSDLEAPGLDLGWPMHRTFVGPTEVTMLVNPSDPDTPSIKEHARRLIKNAQQVIAVAMDMFTDVDIFADLLDAAARRVPVYILLDEQNSHYFTTMVTSFKVNLDMVPMMRVRTVCGTAYFCRTGKSFKGQVMDRFLLVDCRTVLSGNYSFMWSFEKIHRCIAHLFLGELVTTFDEEFRILFAQSQPLVMENAVVPFPGESSGYGSGQFTFKRTQSLRNSRGPFPHLETSRSGEMSCFPFGERMDMDRNGPPFRREDHVRHSSLELGTMQMSNNKFVPQLRMERFLDQGRSVTASRQLEMNAYKRHSYAEGTHESYSSSRQFMKNRVMNNLDEIDSHFQREQPYYHGGGSGSDRGMYDQVGSQAYYHPEQYLESEGTPPLAIPDSYDRVMDYLSSDPANELTHEPGKLMGPGGGRYTQTKPKRPTVGQPYACQSSPTQPHPPDLKHMFPSGNMDRPPQDPGAKQGLRNWRISSYLNTVENSEEEGLPQPLGSDAFDENPLPPERKLFIPELPVCRFGTREFPNITSDKTDMLPRYGKPILPGLSGLPQTADQPQIGSDYKPASELRNTTDDENKAEEVQSREPREISITKHESFRSRLNPMLQRSSRLRSSLIFSSSKLEQHSSLAWKAGSGLDSNDNDDINNPIKTSIVAQILEKRRSMSREPFEWTGRKKLDAADSGPKDATQGDDSSKTSSSEVRVQESLPGEQPQVAPAANPPKHITSTVSSVSMNDPESRLQYFKDLAAKRKASRMAWEATVRSPEPALKKPDLSDKPPDLGLQGPSIVVTTAEPNSEKPVSEEARPKTSVIIAKSFEASTNENEPQRTTETEKDLEVPKKESLSTKPTKPFPSPKFFKKDSLKPFKSGHSRRISCDELTLTDATDAEKSEMKKSRSHSSSSFTRGESSEKLHRGLGSTTSLNLDGAGEGKQDTKAMEFLKKQTQRLKGFLGTKGDKKSSGASEEKAAQSMLTVPEVSEELNAQTSGKGLQDDGSKGEKVNKPASKPSQPRYQSSTTNMLYSSNLRDDTKVILEQISANSQKNRTELTKASPDTKEEAKASGTEMQARTQVEQSSSYMNRNRFLRVQTPSHDRDSILRRIESLRKEKKVYSRFEVLQRRFQEMESGDRWGILSDKGQTSYPPAENATKKSHFSQMC